MPNDPSKTLEILFELKVRDVLRKDVITASPEQKFGELRKRMGNRRISDVPVLDGGKLVGTISFDEIIKWVMEDNGMGTVGERMKRDPQFLYSDQPLLLALKPFQESSIIQFPVIDRDTGKLEGIITKGDLLLGTVKKFEKEFKAGEGTQGLTSSFSSLFKQLKAEQKELHLIFTVAVRDFENSGKASTSIKSDLKEMGVPSEIIRRIAVASYEAEMNLVVHTEKGGTISYIISDKMIRIITKDCGPGIVDIQKAMEPGFSTAPPWAMEMGFGAGMGFHNIKEGSDKMEIESAPGKGTILKIYFFLDTPQ